MQTMKTKTELEKMLSGEVFLDGADDEIDQMRNLMLARQCQISITVQMRLSSQACKPTCLQGRKQHCPPSLSL